MRRGSSWRARSLGLFVAPFLIASMATASASSASAQGPAPAATPHVVVSGVTVPSWLRVSSGRQPPQRLALLYAGYGGALAYDAKREQSVLFVPAANDIYRPYAPSQTWLFDGAARRWSLSPAITPSLLGGHVAYDAQEGVVVLVGSPLDGGSCLDTKPAQTWAWNGTTWTRLHPKTSPGQCSVLNTSMAYDGATHRIIMATTVYAGTVTTRNTWVWDGTTWTHRGRGPLANATVAYDPVSRRVLAFGGYEDHISNHVYAPAYRNETWAWNGNRWAQLSAGGGANDPPARALATMTFDPLVHALVLFGGATAKLDLRYQTLDLNDTWRWAGNHWVQMGTEISPPTMYGASFAYDTAHHIGVLFGSAGTWLLGTARAGGGEYLATRKGGVTIFGDAPFYNTTTSNRLNPPVVGIARNSAHNGYWLAAADGGVSTFGDAEFDGSAGGMHLNRPIVGIAANPVGSGYWLVASDGGIFTFGDAAFDGSAGGMHLNQPIVAMAATPSGNGYWLVASDGGIFTFGDARFFGSTGGMPLSQPIVAMASTPSGDGYWLLSRDGQVFAFGAAKAFGGLTTSLPIAAIASSPTGHGYWVVAHNGVVKGFGDAERLGDTNGKVDSPVVAIATT